MKIINSGNKSLYRGTCTYCNCSVECSKDEVIHNYNITGAPLYTICPNCKNQIIITETIIGNNIEIVSN